MYFNNFVSGPVAPPPYQQPSTQAPTPNAAIGKPLPVPANTATAAPNYVQPDFRKPTTDLKVANYPVGKNPLGIEGPQAPYTQFGQFGENGIPSRGLAIRGVVPLATARGYYGQD